MKCQSGYLTLKILDKLKIQSTKDTEKEYINTYRTYINEYGYIPSPILEYGIKGNGDLSYSFGALALLTIDKRVGELKMTSVLIDNCEFQNKKPRISLCSSAFLGS